LYDVIAVASDSNGGDSAASKPVSATVSPALVVGAPVVSSARVAAGASLTLNASVQGGSGGLPYEWQGLPGGCSGSVPSFTCQPTQAGSFAVSVLVTDSNGASATSGSTTLTVAASTVLGLSTIEFAAIVLAILIAAVVAVVTIMVRRRRRPQERSLDAPGELPSGEGGPEPPALEDPPGPSDH
jgi:subtilase family serine protease